jgi:hypothetical protein
LERGQVWCPARFEVFGVVEAVCCAADEWVQIGRAKLSMLVLDWNFVAESVILALLSGF